MIRYTICLDNWNVFSKIEKLIREPEDPARDLFKNDLNWGPIIKFLSIALKEFSVDNFYPIRLIKLIHDKMIKAKQKNAKDACYDLLITLYKQLGESWKEILKGPLPKNITNKLEKMFIECNLFTLEGR